MSQRRKAPNLQVVVLWPITTSRTREVSLSNTILHATSEVQPTASQFRLMFEASPDGMALTSVAGEVRTMNAAALQLLGASRLSDLQQKPLPSFVADESRPMLLRLLDRAAAGTTGRCEVLINALDTTRWLEVAATPLGQVGHDASVLLTLRDVSEQRHIIESLREREQRFSAAFRGGPVSLSIYDMEGHLVEANDAFCQAAGQPLVEMLGKAPAAIGRIDEAARTRVHDELRRGDGYIRNLELEIVNRDKTTRTALLSVNPVSLGGRPHRLAISVDITELKRSAAALRESQERLRLFIEHAPAALAMLDREMRYVAVSRRWMTDYALPPGSVLGRSHYDVFPGLPQRYRDDHARALAGEVRTSDQDRFTRFDGTQCWLRREVRPWHAGDGSVGGIVIFSEDITVRKEAEEALRDREAMLAQVTDNLPGLVGRVDRDLRYRYVSTGYERVLGRPAAEVVGRTVPELLGTKFPGVEPYIKRVFTGETVSFEHHLQLPGGEPTCNLMRLIPDRGEDGTVQGYFVIGVEITERVQADERHARQRDALVGLTGQGGFDSSQGDAALCRVTEVAARTLAVARVSVWRFTDWCGTLTCLDRWDAKRGRHDAGQQLPITAFPESLWDDQGTVVAAADPTADPRTAHLTPGFVAQDAGALLFVPIRVRGQMVGVLCHEHAGVLGRWAADEETFAMATANLVSLLLEGAERRQAEAELRMSNERFRELAATVEEVFWITDTSKTRMIYVSPAYEAIWGRTCQSLYDDPRGWQTAIHADDRQRVAAAAALQADGAFDEEYRVIRPNGQVRWIRDRAFPVRHADGHIERIVGVALDITDRREAEDRLRQAQKMEAIGQLAGGVAHDFNNILSAIIMQAEVIRDSRHLAQEDREGLRQIAASAQRAANLTRQLLLFGRRQVMQSRTLDVNQIVSDLAKMLRRIIGEHIQLQLTLHHRPLATNGDAGMLDQVLLNLAVNARDAMPHGGRLSITTAECGIDDDAAKRRPEAAPGRYICLTVSDTGTGIPLDVLPKIFEPFFTTKAVGHGTGLGLATVFGVVKQHNGWVDVTSEVGIGSSFKVFLPATTAAGAADAPAASREVSGGHETILLVEDETAVRMMTRKILERRGYRVLEAENGVVALDVWHANRERISLLLTDLVMPEGISGKELARRLYGEQPALKVVYTSGYSADIAGQTLNLSAGETFVEKPFTTARLLSTIRRSLDGQFEQAS